MTIEFKEVITIRWQSEDERFEITSAYPKGFCAIDTWTNSNYESCRKEFTDTLEEAKQWCQDRVR